MDKNISYVYAISRIRAEKSARTYGGSVLRVRLFRYKLLIGASELC